MRRLGITAPGVGGAESDAGVLGKLANMSESGSVPSPSIDTSH